MQDINKDNLFSILTFLDLRSLLNISKTNKYINHQVKTNKKLILKNKVSNIWGSNVVDYIIPDKDIEKFTKYNMKTFLNILELFYYNVLVKNLKVNSYLLIEIYDNVYTFTNKYDNNRGVLFNHRTSIIRDIKKNENIIINENNKNFISICNATAYLNRYVYFLNYATCVTIKKLCEIIEENPLSSY